MEDTGYGRCAWCGKLLERGEGRIGVGAVICPACEREIQENDRAVRRWLDQQRDAKKMQPDSPT